MKRRDYLASAIALAALGGCAGNPTDQSTEEPTTATTAATTTATPTQSTASPTTSAPTPPFSADPRVTLDETSVTPRRLRIRPGTTVTWTNTDTTSHTVESAVFTPGTATTWSYYSADIVPGNSASYTFAEPGVYEYFCTVHGEDTMCGVVIVGDGPYEATLPCEG